MLIANVPHPLDPRPEYVSTPLEVARLARRADRPRRPAVGRHARGPPRLPEHRRLPHREGDRMTGHVSLDDRRPRPRAAWSAVVRAGEIAHHHRPARQPGRRLPRLRRPRHRRALQRARHDPRAGRHLPHHRQRAVSTRAHPADDRGRRRRAAGTTRSAAPAPRSRTPCGTATTPGRSTRAWTTSSPRAPGTASASATSCRNINWYMNVPVEKDGTLGIVDGISAPGLSADPARRARRARPGLQLPPDQQPVQRLRPDAGADGRQRPDDGAGS